jgi:hypothetical protein
LGLEWAKTDVFVVTCLQRIFRSTQRKHWTPYRPALKGHTIGCVRLRILWKIQWFVIVFTVIQCNCNWVQSKESSCKSKPRI